MTKRLKIFYKNSFKDVDNFNLQEAFILLYQKHVVKLINN